METKKYTYHWYIERFENAKHGAERLAETDSALLSRNPAPDTWSAAECLEHLIQFGNIYYENINRGIEIATLGRANSAEPFPPRLIWRGIIKWFEPPYRIKLKTIDSFRPTKEHRDTKNFEKTLNTFLQLQDRFIDQLERCQQQGINLSNEKVSNPVLQFVKMTLSESFAIAEAHQRRHLWQAQKIITTLRKS